MVPSVYGGPQGQSKDLREERRKSNDH